MLKLSNVSIELNNKSVIEKFSLELKRGEIVLLQGKTDVELEAFVGLLQGRLSPTEGLYEFMGEEVSRFSITKATSFRKSQLVYAKLREDFGLNITVEKLLQQPLKYSGIYPSKWKRRLEAVGQLLEIKALMQKDIAELNAMEAFKAYIGRGIILEPKLILVKNPIQLYTELKLTNIKLVVDKLKSLEIGICFLSTDNQLNGIVDEHYIL